MTIHQAAECLIQVMYTLLQYYKWSMFSIVKILVHFTGYSDIGDPTFTCQFLEHICSIYQEITIKQKNT